MLPRVIPAQVTFGIPEKGVVNVMTYWPSEEPDTVKPDPCVDVS